MMKIRKLIPIALMTVFMSACTVLVNPINPNGNTNSEQTGNNDQNEEQGQTGEGQGSEQGEQGQGQSTEEGGEQPGGSEQGGSSEQGGQIQEGGEGQGQSSQEGGESEQGGSGEQGQGEQGQGQSGEQGQGEQGGEEDPDIIVGHNYELINRTDDLIDGDKVVIVSNSHGVAAGAIQGKKTSSYFGAETSKFSSDYSSITELHTGATILTANLTSDKTWTFKNEEGKLLGSDGAKKLVWGSGTTTWNVSIASGDATISSTTSSYGKILFNATNPRFTCYTSNTSSSMLLPQLYKVEAAQPIYPTDIAISGLVDNKLSVGDVKKLSIAFSPADTNQRNLTFKSSNTSVATIDTDGVINARKSGTTTITVSALKADKTYITKSFLLTVVNVEVSSISFDAANYNLSLNSTIKLNATISPSNATNKNVSWNSSDTSVATVSSDGTVTPLKVGQTTITVTTEDSNKTASCVINVVEEQIDAYTIMIYMCGSDLESANGFATSDLKEIKAVKNQPDDVNIIIQTGGSSYWKTSGISASYLQRWEMRNGVMTKKQQLARASMGASSTLEGFVTWGLTEYPAQKTGLILWNHGGALDGVCFDELYDNDPLTDYEVSTAIKNSFLATNRTDKLEWIGYDACLMSVQDIAEQNSHYFNYMVASQETEAGEGWDYDGGWLTTLYKDPININTETLLTEVCTSFIKDNYSEATLATLDLRCMDTYLDAWEDMASGLSNIITSDTKWNSFKTIVNSCKKFGFYDDRDYLPYNGGYVYDIFDAKDLITKLKANSTYKNALASELSVLEAAFNDVIVCTKYTSDYKGSNGMCFFCPLSGINSKSYYSENVTNFRNWRSLCLSYGNWY